jgi:hypothetical protein
MLIAHGATHESRYNHKVLRRFRRNSEIASIPDAPIPDAPIPDTFHEATLEPTPEPNLETVEEWSSAFGIYFDPDFYRDQIDGGSDMDPDEALEHFLTVGWKLGLDASANFSTDGYLCENPDVEAAGLNPLAHYINGGRAGGRRAVPPSRFVSREHWAAERGAALRVELARYLDSLGFDVDLDDFVFPHENSDVDDAGPEWFDAEFYLAGNPDVRVSGRDPLSHFLNGGFRENRLPAPRKTTSRYQPVSDVDRVFMAKSHRPEPHDTHPEVDSEMRWAGDQVVAGLLTSGFRDHDELVIAFGHDDYGTNVGGIQLCAGFEQQQFALLGATYAYIFPVEPRSSLRSIDTHDALVGCRVNGVRLPGWFRLSEFVDALITTSPGGPVVAGIIMHSVLGHQPERIAEAIERLSPRKLVWWVHDFSSHCANFLLLRNGVNFCGDPQLDSQSCTMCSFGRERTGHVVRVRNLMDDFDWELCAPSVAAADVSIAGGTPLPRRPRVVPHGQLVGSGATASTVVNEGRVRVAFIGHPAFHKGWDTFMEFSRSSSADLFEFFHFGVDDQMIPGIKFVKLKQQFGNLGLTTDLLVERGIDAVINWPRWKETFNFVNYESLAAGCLVITNPDSGHVVDAAREFNRAIVFDSIEDLLSDGGLAERIRLHHREVPRQLKAFEMTGLSPALIAVTSSDSGGGR